MQTERVDQYMITWSGSSTQNYSEGSVRDGGTPEIDFFASRLNNQVDPYCSWKPDPGGIRSRCYEYRVVPEVFLCLPPLNMIGRVLKKVEEEGAEGIIVVPYWPTQPWFAKFLKMCLYKPFVLYRRDAQPTLEHPWRNQSMLPKTRILADRISSQQQGSATKPKTHTGILAAWNTQTIWNLFK